MTAQARQDCGDACLPGALKGLAAGAVLALSAGCTSIDYDLAGLAPAAGGASAGHVAVRNPRFGDSNPHAWSERPPWTYEVHGTDVSRYQADVDWARARDSGIAFAFVKATEGADMLDPRFHEHWRGAGEAGIARSAYHFFYFCRTAEEQAAWFIRNVPRERTSMPHVLDMEWNPHSPTCRLRPPPATVHREMRVFLERIERHYGKRPVIYTSVDFYHDNRLNEFHGYDWWLRSVADHPRRRYDGQNFLFWQYTGTGIVPGIEGNADINVFNGTQRQWRDWLAAQVR